MAEDNQEQTRSFQNDFTYIKTMRCSWGEKLNEVVELSRYVL
jgi:hypothetical protein